MKQGLHKWTFVGDIAITFTTGGQLPEQSWDGFISDLKRKPVSRYLATNVGSAEVTSLQRKKFVDLSKVKPFPVAVVTDERVVRGLVTAISWLGVNVKAFAWSELHDATKHLGMDETLETNVVDAIKDLMKQCGPDVDFRRLTGFR
jgi:hypothetical protein